MTEENTYYGSIDKLKAVEAESEEEAKRKIAELFSSENYLSEEVEITEIAD